MDLRKAMQSLVRTVISKWPQGINQDEVRDGEDHS